MPAERRRGIATVCLSGTLEDKLTAAAAAGFDGVEIFENDLLASPWSPARVRRECAHRGLTIDLYQPFRDFEAVPPAVLARNLRRAELKFDVVEQLGADTILVCSSVSPDAVDDDDLAAQQLRTLAERAGERGLRVAYEALAWGRFVNTYDHAWRVVRAADHPALGVCLDSFHVLSREVDPVAIRTIPGDKVFFVQLADAPRLRMDVLQWSRHHRLFPGQGAFDLTSFVDHVLATGYRGPLSLEVFNDVFRQSDPFAAAVDAMRSLLLLQESADAAPVLEGHAFTEIDVDDTAAARVGSALAGLGFTAAGRHRTKPVELWRQGGARVVLNHRRPVDGGHAAVTAVAVASTDPTTSSARAKAFLAPSLGSSAVAAPDGTSVIFCRDDLDWLADFAPFDTAAGVLDAGVLDTDHVGLTEPFDRFQQAGLFYRAVLGLDLADEAEFAAPFGLVRRHSVADRGHRVRVALDSTLVRRGTWGPDVREPQHVAFSTSDAIAGARRMRDLGAPLLDIPDNYYDDLDARFAPDPDFLASLRSLSVLYDRDGSGEFLHFCTELLGDRVYFEVVQRIGGYQGYGAVNAPVVMAAHRRRRKSAG
ncbi:TIM barrel protein [Umezawaea endophytica]|uniref:3-dehydroshikimate dehydratase n=1 Tax=Umezawaea endophytica TaxID=1654476 RepID=A0A9X3AGR6_9PSEU|nr:sugar phosphate isomerase/epimerase and 4-hydroxyphenylpyruvate domain-containing protein [Umezawaea endophytica]MCS7478680.1 TIM barrel protein [Umezawaea endophytica]